MLLAALVAHLCLAGPLQDGVALLSAKRYDEARKQLEAATAAAPEDPAGWWQLGTAQYALGEFAAAAQSWKRCRDLAPQFDASLPMRLAGALARTEWAGTDPTTALVPTAADTSTTITIAAIGDTMMGSDLRLGAAGLPAGDGEGLFAETKAWLAGADIGFANLEGPLADGLPSAKCAPDATACYAFRTPTRYVNALVSAGIDVGQLANNHAMDVGTAGLLSSMATLDRAGIAHAGAYGDVAFVERDGLRVAFVAAHSGSCCLNVNDLDEVARAVAWADAQADLVVFVFHGGAEGSGARHVPKGLEVAWGEHRGDVHALAHAAIDAGADLVVGSGPHVLRAMEVYRGRLVAYSLGNYCGYKQFATSGPTGRSVVLEATLAANGVLVSARVLPIAVGPDHVPRVDPQKLGIADLAELSAADFPATGVKVGPDGIVSW